MTGGTRDSIEIAQDFEDYFMTDMDIIDPVEE